jgi:3-dehydroquinate synthase
METVDVALGERSYRILIGTDLLAGAGESVAAALTPRKTLVVTDETVAGLYLEPVATALSGAGFDVTTITVPPGETSKCHEQLIRLYEACFDAHLERGSLVVALGGGVVGDLGGFAAASYMRGLPCVQMPTTLLSQVDSSVGGKTGINLPGGKNLVGAFHQPSLVLADVGSLRTLDDRQFATGMAEVVKHAMIRDAELFDHLEAAVDNLAARDAAALEPVVAWNCRIKAAVVAADEREGGVRAILNYGHTVGHAIEAVAHYGTLTHGEAVALGMNAEADIARLRGLIDDATHQRQQALLARFGLAEKLPAALDVGELILAMQRDKKTRGGKVRFVLPEAVGSVQIVDDVTRSELQDVLDRLQP